MSPDVGEDGFRDSIALFFGFVLLIAAVVGLTLGGATAILAKRSQQAPAEVRGTRRQFLIAGLTVIGGELLAAAVLEGPWGFWVVLAAPFAFAFLVIAVASRRRREFVPASVLALALVGLGTLSLASLIFEARVGP